MGGPWGPIRGGRATVALCRCTTGGHTAPEIAGPTDTESLQTAGGCLAPRPRGIGRLDGRAVGYGGVGWIGNRRVTCGRPTARVPGEYCRWVGMGEYTPFGIVCAW